jgi:uncharacterized protein YydD (DUF2326 family)
MESLNLTGKTFCEAIGIAYNGQILQSLRELQLVGFFKIGKKYMYYQEDVKKISDKLRRKEIFIKTNGGYYVTLNNKPLSA